MSAETRNFAEKFTTQMKTKYNIVIFLAVLLAMVSCGKSGEKSKSDRRAEAQKERARDAAAFKVAVTPTIDCLPLYLLKDSMLYDSTKADIRLKTFNAHMDIDTALVGGSVQAAATELVRIMDLRRGHKVQLRAVAVTPLQWALIGNKNNGITSLKRLGNHMIAMTRYSATDWLTSQIKKESKTDSIIFSVQVNDVALRYDMFQNNEMDAAWLPEPYASAALLHGRVKLAASDAEGRSFGLVVYREPGTAEADVRERQLEEFKRAWDRAVELINHRGLRYYSALIKKYMHVDDKAIARLPKITFKPCEGPSRADVIAAEKIHFVKHTPKVQIR